MVSEDAKEGVLKKGKEKEGKREQGVIKGQQRTEEGMGKAPLSNFGAVLRRNISTGTAQSQDSYIIVSFGAERNCRRTRSESGNVIARQLHSTCTFPLIRQRRK